MIVCPVSGNIFYSFESCEGVDCGGFWWGDRWGLYCTYYLSYVRLDSVYLFNGEEEEEEEERVPFSLDNEPITRRFTKPTFQPSFSYKNIVLGCSHCYNVSSFKTGIKGRRVVSGLRVGVPTIKTIVEEEF